MSLLKTASWIFFDKVFLIVLSTVSFYVFASYLDPSELGLGVLYVSVPILISILFSGMIEHPLVSKEKVNNDEYSTVFWFAIGLGITLTTLYILVGSYFIHDGDWHLLFYSSLSIVFVLAGRPFLAKLRRDQDFRSIALRALLAKCLSFVVALYLAIYGYGAIAIVGQFVVQEFISFAVMAVMAREVLALRFKRALLSNTLRMGRYVSITAFSNTVMTNGLTLALGSVAGAYSVGLYNFANRIVSLPSEAIFNGLISYALPALSKHQKNRALLKESYRKLFKFALIIIFPVFVGIVLVSSQIVDVIFGSEWSQSVIYLKAIGIIALIRTLYIFHSSIFLVLGAPNVISKKEVLSSLFCLCLVFVLGPTFDAGSAVISTALYSILTFFWCYYAMKQVLDYTLIDFLNDVKTPALSALFMSVCVIGMEVYVFPNESTWLALSSLIVFGVVSYASSLLVMEREFVNENFHKLRQKTQ